MVINVKYFIWICVFMAYILCFIGVFTLIGSITDGIKVERVVETELSIQGEITLIEREVEVEFNELPEVVMTLGMAGLFISMSVTYILSNSLLSTWNNDDVTKKTKSERLIRIGVFIFFFLIFSFIFSVHQVSELLTLPGFIFMALTCGASLIVTNTLCKMLHFKQKHSELTGNGEGVV